MIKKVIEAGGIEYAIKMMNSYKDEALSILNEFEDCDAKKGLEELVNFTTGTKILVLDNKPLSLCKRDGTFYNVKNRIYLPYKIRSK